VLEVIIRRANLQTTGTIYNKETQLLAYADDIDIVGRSQSALRDAYLALEGEAAKVGLKINDEKTKYMIAAQNDRTIRDVGQSVAIGDKHFEVVKEFVYGSETWVLTKREENQLLVFERKVRRTICAQKIENGVYRRRYNHEVDKEFNSPNALNVTYTSRLRYALSHDQKTQKRTTKSSVQSQTQCKEDQKPVGRKA
jgi:hypothetical protein